MKNAGISSFQMSIHISYYDKSIIYLTPPYLALLLCLFFIGQNNAYNIIFFLLFRRRKNFKYFYEIAFYLLYIL